MKLIVGLGNPGKAYQLTRHNIGFLVIDRLSKNNSISLKSKKFNTLMGSGRISGFQILLAKPETFMNLCGQAVRDISRYFNIAPHDIIVIHDDIDLAFGKIKIKSHGGSGGHRGINSIISCIHENAFIRIRVGIGRPPCRVSSSDYVLQPFTDEEKETVPEIVYRAEKCIDMILSEGISNAMNIFHNRNITENFLLKIKKD